MDKVMLILTFMISCLIVQPCVEASSQCLIAVLSMASTFDSEVRDRCTWSNTVSQHNLMVITLENGNKYEALVPFISALNLQGLAVPQICSKTIRDIEVVFGDIDAELATILDTFVSRFNLNLTIATTTPLPLDLPNVLNISPLSHYIEATVSFLDQWNWTRIGIISAESTFAAEKLYKQLKQIHVTATPIAHVRREYNLTNIFGEIRVSGTHVIVVLTSRALGCWILEEARKLGYIWPDYAWLVFDLESRKDSAETMCSMEGAVLFKSSLPLENCGGTCNCVTSNGSSLSSLYGQIRNASIGIVVPVNQSYKIDLAVYVPRTKHLEVQFNLSALDYNALNGTAKFVVGYRTPEGSIVIISAATTFSFIFVTVVLILYVCFHSQPEVKATSVSVSLCMFLGCYLLLLFVPTYIAEAQPGGISFISANVLCNILALLSCTGFPATLISATLIVKLLRVYAIIENPLFYQKKKNRRLLSDAFLLLYIMLLTLPHLLIFVVWFAYDPLLSHDIEYRGKDFLLSTNRCLSLKTSLSTWLALQLAYIITLLAALAILSFKTLEMRYKHFQDTKATNAYIFTTIFGTLSTVFYWSFFRTLEPSADNLRAVEHTAYIGSLLIVMSNQVLLFTPKVYPPFKRWLKSHKPPNRFRILHNSQCCKHSCQNQ